MSSNYDKSLAELEWFFCRREAALGLHGQSFEGGAQTVWDDAKIHRAHMGMRTFGHRREMRNETRIPPTIGQLVPTDVAVLRAAFQPGAMSPMLRLAFVRRGWNGTLAGVALTTMAARQLAGARPVRLVLEDVATSPQRRVRLANVRTEAFRLFDEALAAYEALRALRVGIEIQERREDLERIRAGLA